ncbi:MAG TPA: hypothetical protein VGS20_08280 [Candidatus Acidoferrales bacterium]|nr:hypothetical protein [Candidatus Acidoferrales bacterium]
MPDATDPRQTMELYLLRVRRALGRLPEGEIVEILRELRSHIQERADRAGAITRESVQVALEALGDPVELARMYLNENLVARAVASRSPWLILRAIFRWACLSAGGFLVFLLALTGYGTGIAFLFCAALKPFFPGHVGLWWRRNPILFDLGAHWPIPAGARELLGWWMIPVSVVAGLALFLLTHRFTLASIRRFRHFRLMPA